MNQNKSNPASSQEAPSPAHLGLQYASQNPTLERPSPVAFWEQCCSSLFVWNIFFLKPPSATIKTAKKEKAQTLILHCKGPSQVN